VVEDWRRLHNEDLHNLYLSTHTTMIKSKRMRWASHVAFMGQIRNTGNILVILDIFVDLKFLCSQLGILEVT
jgi:hypothetical protein